MITLAVRKMLRSLSSHRGSKSRRQDARVLGRFEAVEDRTLMATFTWNGGAGNFGTATNWTPNGVPGTSLFDSIVIPNTASAITLDITPANTFYDFTFNNSTAAVSFNFNAGTSIKVGRTFGSAGPTTIDFGADGVFETVHRFEFGGATATTFTSSSAAAKIKVSELTGFSYSLAAFNTNLVLPTLELATNTVPLNINGSFSISGDWTRTGTAALAIGQNNVTTFVGRAGATQMVTDSTTTFGTTRLDLAAGEKINVGNTTLNTAILQINAVDTPSDAFLGTFNVSKDVQSSDTSVSPTATIVMNGTGNGVVSASVTGAQFPNLTFSKTGAGTVTLAGGVVLKGNLNQVSNQVNQVGGIINFEPSITATYTFLAAQNQFTGIKFDFTTAGTTLTINGELNINGNLETRAGRRILPGTGNGSVTLNGSGGQSITADNGDGSEVANAATRRSYLGNVRINKGGGAVSVEGRLWIATNWDNASNSIINFGTGTEDQIIFEGRNGLAQITAGSNGPFHNVQFSSAAMLNTSPTRVNGVLVFDDGDVAGVIDMFGSKLRVSSIGASRDLTVHFKSSTNQTADTTPSARVAGTDQTMPKIVVNKPSGNLGFTGSQSTALRGLVRTAGTIQDSNANGYRLLGGTYDVNDTATTFTNLVTITDGNLSRHGPSTFDSPLHVTNLTIVNGFMALNASTTKLFVAGNLTINPGAILNVSGPATGTGLLPIAVTGTVTGTFQNIVPAAGTIANLVYTSGLGVQFDIV